MFNNGEDKKGPHVQEDHNHDDQPRVNECSKLEGFNFWKKSLHSAKYVVAPMVDQSELAWRMLSRRYGAQLCYTPMYHSSVFIRDEKYRRDALLTCQQDRPLIVQFCGNDPEIILKAAQYTENMCEAVDINLGCPQSIAKRGHYGAFLQDEWDILHKIVNLCHRKLKVPITCKMRVFEDIEKTVKYAQMLENAGCQLLTVHGRTRQQKGPNTGLASWKHIKAIKEHLHIPVFANGNIQYLEDAQQCMEETGVDGIMSAEGNLHNPAIFSGQQPLVWQMAEQYLELVKDYPCPLSFVRGHLFKILHHALVQHKEPRKLLGGAKNIGDMHKAVEMVKSLAQDDVAKYQENPEDVNFELPLPYWICQPYERPCPKDACHHEHKNVKRPHEKIRPKENNERLLSKNQLKKLKRNPNKKFETRKTQYEKCESCGNPKGQKCTFQCCKLCCRKKCFDSIADCQGHHNLYKTKLESKRTVEEKEVQQKVPLKNNGDSNDVENNSVT